MTTSELSPAAAKAVRLATIREDRREAAVNRARLAANAMERERLKRDRSIREAVELGASLRELAARTGLTPEGVRQIVRREVEA